MRNTVLGLIAWVLIFAAGSAMYAQSATSSIAKNELGLVVGASEVPSVALQNGGRVNLNSSLALGAEYDRHVVGRHTALYGGGAFLPPPLPVQNRRSPMQLSPQQAGRFPTPP